MLSGSLKNWVSSQCWMPSLPGVFYLEQPFTHHRCHYSPPGDWTVWLHSPKLMTKIMQNRKEMRIRENVPHSAPPLFSSETWKPIHFNTNPVASAQDERVHLKGDGKEAAWGSLWLSFLAITGLRKRFIWGQKRAQSQGSGSLRSSSRVQGWPWARHFPHWPLVSLPWKWRSGIRPGVSVRALQKNRINKIHMSLYMYVCF